MPKDYQLVYFSTSQGIVTVPADNISTRVVRNGSLPRLSARVDDGEWINNSLVSRRPHSLVLLDGNGWKTMSLRSDAAQGIVNTPASETRPVCPQTGAVAFSDYAAPQNSLVFYLVDGGDGQCGSEDDLITGFRIGSSNMVNLGRLLPRHAFYGSTGNITGYLVQVESELRLYTPGTSNFRVVATGIVGEVREAAATASAVWMIWNTGSSHAIYRVAADGTRSAALYSAVQFIYSGSADANAMYVSHLVSNTSSSVIRVPYTGSATALATMSGNSQVMSSSTNALLLLNFASNVQSASFAVLSKSGGTPVTVSTTSPSTPLPFFQTQRVTSGNQFLLNLYETDSGGSVDTTAVLVNEQGQIVERFANSEWIAATSTNRDLNQTTLPPARRALQVQSYSNSRHQGGSLIVRDFSSGTRTVAATLTRSGVLQASNDATASDLAQLVATEPSGSNIDLFAFDLDTPQFVQLTNTQSEQESIP